MAVGKSLLSTRTRLSAHSSMLCTTRRPSVPTELSPSSAQPRAIQACPICGGGSIRPFRFGLHQCPSCQAAFSASVWNTGADARLEEEWFDSGSYDSKVTYWVRLFEKWNSRRTWGRLKSVGFTSGKLLEVGVGSGSLLAFMKKRGFEVEGCDLAKEVCLYVERTHGCKMHCGPLNH